MARFGHNRETDGGISSAIKEVEEVPFWNRYSDDKLNRVVQDAETAGIALAHDCLDKHRNCPEEMDPLMLHQGMSTVYRTNGGQIDEQAALIAQSHMEEQYGRVVRSRRR